MSERSIEEYLDLCFSRFEETQEVKDLKEEILMNAKDRYKDCIDNGMSPEDAGKRVIESLGDLDSLLNEMHAQPRSSASDLNSTVRDFVDAGKDFAKAGKSFGEQFGELFRSRYSGRKEVESAFAGVRRLELELVSADIRFSVSRDECVHLEAGGMTEGLEIREDQDTGVVRIKEPMAQASIFSGGMDMRLEIPADSTVDVVISTRSGDISLGSICINSLQCSMTSGDLVSSGCSIRSTAVNAKSGDVTLRLDKPADDVEIVTASGDADLACSGSIRLLNVKTSSGDVDVETCGPFDQYEIHAVSGDVQCMLNGVPSVDYQGSTVTGDVRIRKPQSAGGSILHIHTVSGDITVH